MWISAADEARLSFFGAFTLLVGWQEGYPASTHLTYPKKFSSITNERGKPQWSGKLSFSWKTTVKTEVVTADEVGVPGTGTVLKLN